MSQLNSTKTIVQTTELPNTMSQLNSRSGYSMSSSITIAIDEHSDYSRNEIFKAAEIYLCTKISPTTRRFKVIKTSKNKKITIRFEKNEEIIDSFENFTVKWTYINNDEHNVQNKKLFELSFDQKFRNRVLEQYLPYVLNVADEIKSTNKVVKLYSMQSGRQINLDHPSTFETLAMDPEMKKEIIDDLERFLKRRDYYKKVGKAWKRGYLLYGPPGTGKSSLIAAMANYLHFDIYDLELTSIRSNSELRDLFVSTNNRSIIVIEDIDCSSQMHDRNDHIHHSDPNSKLTLSGMLNFIDGLWSSCGDERIIVFTTNHKDRLDPALLRPGRMDFHIHMSYCTYPAFKILASNYHGINDHDPFFREIEELLEIVQVTPAEIAEELMRSEDPDIALAGVVKILNRKKIKASDEVKPKEGDVEEERKNIETSEEVNPKEGDVEEERKKIETSEEVNPKEGDVEEERKKIEAGDEVNPKEGDVEEERKEIDASDEVNPKKGDVEEERSDGSESNSERGRISDAYETNSESGRSDESETNSETGSSDESEANSETGRGDESETNSGFSVMTKLLIILISLHIFMFLIVIYRFV